MSKALEELAERYSRMTTEELFAITTTDFEHYEPEAVDLAQQELLRRGVPEEGTEELFDEAMQRLEHRETVRDDPLMLGALVICFLLPLPAGPIVFFVMAQKGRRLASKQAVLAMVFGVFFWTLVRALLDGH